MDALIREVAQLLTMEVKCAEGKPEYWELVGQEGYSIGLLENARNAKGRLVIRPRWRRVGNEYLTPSNLLKSGERGQYAQEITVDPTRPATAIAKDIERRLLVDLRRLWPLTEAAIEARRVKAAQRAAIIADLAQATGCTRTDTASVKDRVHFYNHGGGQLNLSGEGDEVRMELHGVPLATAHQILAVLNKGA